LLAPVFFISIFLAVLTIIIGLFLMRRVVTPLSEVIAAARAVAAGDLSTRVHVSGPDDLRALSDSFNHMADALERSDYERRNMLADIAHELRTPLTVIRGRLEGIVDGVYPADEGHVVPALEETYLLERLVEDLRLLTLVETHQLPFERREVDLTALAARVVELFRAEAEEKGIHLSLGTSEAVNVHLDPQRTEQVVSNLVSNALRYTPEGGNVWITVTKAVGSALLAVSDNGPGVPEDDIPHLFDRFWRGEKSRSRTSGGAGLGLAIARQLVEAQNGTITASNRPEGGLELRVEFALS
jgi:signal transduction histidine kinase